LTIFGTLQIV